MTDKIDRLVGSTYRGLSPSHSGKEELMANLPERQAAPRRPLWIPIAAVLLIGAAIAIGRSRDRGEPDIVMADGAAPVAFAPVAKPGIGLVQKSMNEVHVRVAQGGRVQVVVGKTWTDVNLNQLGEHLGRAGKDRWVVLLVDKDTPWVHIQWMMMICAEQRMPKLAFQVKGFRLDASLLVDPGVGMGPAEAEEPDKRVPPVNRARDIAVKILALPGDEVEAAWGVAARRQRVMMPTTVRYKFAGRESDELASVARWMTGAMKAAPDAHGVIQAMAKTRFGTVAKLLAEFRHAGFKRVDFFGTRIPSRAERTAITLPYPQ